MFVDDLVEFGMDLCWKISVITDFSQVSRRDREASRREKTSASNFPRNVQVRVAAWEFASRGLGLKQRNFRTLEIHNFRTVSPFRPPFEVMGS